MEQRIAHPLTSKPHRVVDEKGKTTLYLGQVQMGLTIKSPPPAKKEKE